MKIRICGQESDGYGVMRKRRRGRPKRRSFYIYIASGKTCRRENCQGRDGGV